MPPWGAGSKPKKTPANTVRNSTYSTSNRFSGPPGTTTPGGPPGSGGASQISRPALAAATQINRPSVPQPNTPQAAPTPQFDMTPYQPQIQQIATSGYRLMPPPAAPSSTADMNMVAQAQRAGAGDYDRTVFSPQELMSAATSGSASAPAAQAVQQAAPPTPNELMGLRYTAAAEAYQDPATGYAQSQAPAPSPDELAGLRYQEAAKVYGDSPGGYQQMLDAPTAFGGAPPTPNELMGMRYEEAARTYTEDPGAYQQMLNAPTYGSPGAMGWQPSQQELMRAATSGAATHPAAQRVQQAAPSFSQEELMRAATSGAATHPAAQAIQQAAPASAAPGSVGPSPSQLVQGSQGAQEQEIYKWLGTEGAQNLLASNAAAAAPAAAPAWDPAMNDPAITDPVGMWTDPTSGGQMPDPADAEAWERMQRVVDSEFGPDQSIYNPEYDTERFPTYDPNDTIAPFARQGGDPYVPNPYVPTGGVPEDNYGGGPSPELGTYNPNTGEELQFGSELADIESQRGLIDEADSFWDLAHQRKWDEYNRGLPGQYNSRGMLDSGLFPRAKAFSLADQDYEQKVQDWQVLNQKAAFDAQQAAAERGLTAARSGAVFDPWTSSYRVGR